jgi:hypothetical protein
MVRPSLYRSLLAGLFLAVAGLLNAQDASESELAKATKGQQWVVPFGGGAGKVFKIGKQPVNLNGQLYYNASRPDGTGGWQSRVQLQFLFPK